MVICKRDCEIEGQHREGEMEGERHRERNEREREINERERAT